MNVFQCSVGSLNYLRYELWHSRPVRFGRNGNDAAHDPYFVE